MESIAGELKTQEDVWDENENEKRRHVQIISKEQPQ